MERVFRAAGRSLDPSDADDTPPELVIEEPSLASPGAGDPDCVLVFPDAAAYGFSMSKNYPSRSLTPEGLVGSELRLVWGQTPDELLALEEVPA